MLCTDDVYIYFLIWYIFDCPHGIQIGRNLEFYKAVTNGENDIEFAHLLPSECQLCASKLQSVTDLNSKLAIQSKVQMNITIFHIFYQNNTWTYFLKIKYFRNQSFHKVHGNKGKVEKILKGSLDSAPITFTFSENSNYGRKSLLEV